MKTTVIRNIKEYVAKYWYYITPLIVLLLIVIVNRLSKKGNNHTVADSSDPLLNERTTKLLLDLDSVSNPFYVRQIDHDNIFWLSMFSKDDLKLVNSMYNNHAKHGTLLYQLNRVIEANQILPLLGSRKQDYQNLIRKLNQAII